MSETAPKYFVTTEIKFPSLSIQCTVSHSRVSGTPELHVKNYAELDEIIGKESGLLKDVKDKYNIKYKFISLPTIGMTSRWTGVMQSADWAELHNKQASIEGSFKFTFNRIQKSDQTTWHIVNIECISTTVILD